MRTPLTLREWLEDMRRFAGRDAQRATDLLAVLDEVDDNERLLEAWGEKVAADPDEAKAKIDQLEAFEAVMERDDMAIEFGGDTDNPVERLKEVLQYAKLCEQRVDALRDLAADAGLITDRDYATDPLPLIRMFLPVE